MRLSENDRANGWALCERHGNPIKEDFSSCGNCSLERSERDDSPDEPDYDLMAKYGDAGDRYGDDHGLATALVGYGWWKGV